MERTLCECSDPECPACQDDQALRHGCCGKPAVAVLYRIDMVDETGTPMCEPCAEDAHASGLFSDTHPSLWRTPIGPVRKSWLGAGSPSAK